MNGDSPPHPIGFSPTCWTLPPEVLSCLGRLADDCPPRGRGWCVAAACILEATVPKPGNVHPGASFDDLCHDELVAAALAIAPVMERAPRVRLGTTIEAAVSASRAVTRSNANLGIVLAIAPLAAVREDGPPTVAGVTDVLARLDRDDAAATWRAIATAVPGGLGRAARFDLHDPAPDDLLAAMREAAAHDAVARLWAEAHAPLFAGPVRDLVMAVAAGMACEDAVLHAFLAQLARTPDSLIARRHGADVAATVSTRAAAVLGTPRVDRPAAVAAFDHDLRVPRRINPGTTADLIAASIYTVLRATS
jgi:triphosphoribosyl-dephospho-CoA synthase